MKPPEYLYHYTSIESLALILDSRKVLFNAMKYVDDLNEGKSKDFKFIDQYFFVSCWTDLKEESIPFWNMYTNDMKGVRIKMPYNFLQEYDVNVNNVAGLKDGIYKSIVPNSESFTNEYWIPPTEDYLLKKVVYTNDLKTLYPTLYEIEKNEWTFDFRKIGQQKSLHWSFQSEWRFIIKIIPITTKFPVKLNNIISHSLHSMKKGDPIPFKKYLADIDIDKFQKMELLLGPKITQSEKIIVESLINKYNPKANISVSELHGKIR